MSKKILKTEPEVVISFRIPKKLRQRLRIIAAMKGVSVQEIAFTLFSDYAHQHAKYLSEEA